MTSIPTMGKVHIETLAVGREAVNHGPLAIIANALANAPMAYERPQFADGTSTLGISALASRENGRRRYRPL